MSESGAFRAAEYAALLEVADAALAFYNEGKYTLDHEVMAVLDPALGTALAHLAVVRASKPVLDVARALNTAMILYHREHPLPEAFLREHLALTAALAPPKPEPLK